MKRAVMAWLGRCVLAASGALASWGCLGDDGAAGDGAATDGRDGPSQRFVDDESAGTGQDRSAEQREAEQNDAEQSDLALIAGANGWTREEAELYQAKSDAAGEVSGRLTLERPDVFVGSAVGPEPSDAPRMYVKGVADERVHQIVDAAAFEIQVIDRQPYSRAEIDQRQSLLIEELRALGFQSFAVGTDIQREGLMEATLQRVSGAPGTVEELLAALPAALRERLSISLVDEPVASFA